MDINFSKTLVAQAQYPNEAVNLALNLPELDKLQEEVESLKQQTKLIEQKQKKRSWKKRGRKF